MSRASGITQQPCVPAGARTSGDVLITQWRAAQIALLCLSALGVFLWLPVFRPVGVVLLVAAIFLGSGAFTIAGRTARALQFLRGQPVHVLAWGLPLPTPDGPLYVESIASLGVGLLIQLQVAPGAGRILLKIAQPRDVLISVTGATVGRAAYVQWASRRLQRGKADRSPALILEPVQSNGQPAFGAPAA